jgi:SulP family sulfate permease
MTRPILSRLAKEFHPRQLLPSLTAGSVAGIVVIVFEISLAALVFSGDLSGYVSNGIGLMLFGALAIGIVVSLTSSFPGMISIPQDSPAAILTLMAATIVSRVPPLTKPEDLFATIVVAIAMTSLLTGLAFFALGWFKLGGLIRYIPYPVVGGFLAGTGLLLVQGAVGVMLDASFSLGQIPLLFQAGMWPRWLPGLVFAVLLLLILRRYSHFLIMPAMLVAAVWVFYLLLWLTGTPVAEASAQGWLLGPFPEGALWQPPELSLLKQADWSTVLSQGGSVGTILIVSVVSLLLNASGLELTIRRDIDLNHELRSAGIANLVAGLGGSPVGYHTLSFSTLGHRLGSTSRLVGLFSAALCAAALFFGAPLLSFFPKPLLGGLLCFLGLTFLVEWVYDAWFKLPGAEYLIVLLISVVINTVGVLEGVGLGIALAVVLFVVSYSRLRVVKHTLSGVNFQSNVDRPRLYRQLLRAKGEWVYILELQGFIFFGTANKLVNQVRERIADPDLLSPRFVVLDFRQVRGLDASAALSFAKMKQLAESQSIVLVFTHLSPQIQRQLEREVLLETEEALWRIFPDLDHGIEWCEKQLIQVFDEVGIAAERRSVKQRFEGLSESDKFTGLFEYLTQGDEEQQKGDPFEPLSAAISQEYMERKEAEKGYCLIRQGDIPEGLYFIETGGATIQREFKDGGVMRLRKMKAGTVVGEVGLYMGSKSIASVVIDQPSTIHYLSGDRLKQMEKADPAMAVAFHKFIAQLLSERLSGATDTIEALLK